MTDYTQVVKELTELLEKTKFKKDEMDPAEYKRVTRKIRADRRKYAKMDPNAPVPDKKSAKKAKRKSTKKKKVKIDTGALYTSVIAELENSGLELRKFKTNDLIVAISFFAIVNAVENGELDIVPQLIKRFKIKWMAEPTFFVEFKQGESLMLGLGPVTHSTST